jgi:hypothetical protein
MNTPPFSDQNDPHFRPDAHAPTYGQVSVGSHGQIGHGFPGYGPAASAQIPNAQAPPLNHAPSTQTGMPSSGPQTAPANGVPQLPNPMQLQANGAPQTTAPSTVVPPNINLISRTEDGRTYKYVYSFHCQTIP